MQKKKQNAPVATGYQMQPQRQTGIVVKHREFVRAVVSQTAFTNRSDLVNPGFDSLFPWLSPQAEAWEKYRFRKLKFIYVPTCSTSTPGRVGMVFDYDPEDGEPLGERPFMNMFGAINFPPWQKSELNVDIKRLDSTIRERYTASVATGQDMTETFAGLFNYYVEGQSTEGISIGSLFVDYEIEMLIPEVKSGLTAPEPRGIVSYVPTASTVNSVIDQEYSVENWEVYVGGGFGLPDWNVTEKVFELPTGAWEIAVTLDSATTTTNSEADCDVTARIRFDGITEHSQLIKGRTNSIGLKGDQFSFTFLKVTVLPTSRMSVTLQCNAGGTYGNNTAVAIGCVIVFRRLT